MNTNQYQVWEGEMEAAGLEENGVSLFSAFFSALLGILLFLVLIVKTVFAFAFRTNVNAKKKIASAMKANELKMSVS
jgi:hypothetical protein